MKKSKFYRTVQIPAGYEFESTEILPVKGVMKCRIHIRRIPTNQEVAEEYAKMPEPTEPGNGGLDITPGNPGTLTESTEAPQDATRQDGILPAEIPKEPAKD